MRRIPAVRAVIRQLDIPIWTRIYGVRWPVRLRLLRDIAYLVNRRTHEPEILALFMAISLVHKPRSFWDVGAGIGVYSWVLKSLDPALEVVMFEPDPVSSKLIHETLHRGGLEGMSVLSAAASDRTGRGTFARDEVTGATGSLEPLEQGYNQIHFGIRAPLLSVETVSIDDARAQRSTPVDLLKIDVEGHEDAVFRGAVNTLSRDLPTIMFESFSGHDAIRTDLGQKGYEIWDAERQTTDLSLATNFLAVPPPRRAMLPTLLQQWRQVRAEIGL
jgi:FkbM family methyltransferase